MEDSKPVLLAYTYSYGDGHAVVVYNAEKGEFSSGNETYDRKAYVYDNKQPNLSKEIYLNSVNETWRINGDAAASSAQGATMMWSENDVNVINYHGYLSQDTTVSESGYISMISAKAVKSNYKIVPVMIDADTGTTFNAGEEDLFDLPFFGEGDENSGDIRKGIEGNVKECVMYLDEFQPIETYMCFENELVRVTSGNGNRVVFSNSGKAELFGKSGEFSLYSIDLVSNEGYMPTDWYKMTIKSSGGHVIFQKYQDGYLLNADKMENVHVTAKNDDVTARVCFSSEYDTVYLYELDENTIAVAVDADYNGTYETVIAKSLSVPFGDLNQDNVVGADDAAQVLIAAAMLGSGADSGLTNDQWFLADVNEDDLIDATDATTILQYAAALGSGASDAKIEDFT